MGLYHGVDHYEQMKISDKSWTEPFVKGWPDLLQSQTVFRFAWSYIIAWVGVGMCLGSCVLFFMASMCIRSDKRREEAMNMQYLMPGMLHSDCNRLTKPVKLTGLSFRRLWFYSLNDRLKSYAQLVMDRVHETQSGFMGFGYLSWIFKCFSSFFCAIFDYFKNFAAPLRDRTWN